MDPGGDKGVGSQPPKGRGGHAGPFAVDRGRSPRRYCGRRGRTPRSAVGVGRAVRPHGRVSGAFRALEAGRESRPWSKWPMQRGPSRLPRAIVTGPKKRASARMPCGDSIIPRAIRTGDPALSSGSAYAIRAAASVPMSTATRRCSPRTVRPRSGATANDRSAIRRHWIPVNADSTTWGSPAVSATWTSRIALGRRVRRAEAPWTPRRPRVRVAAWVAGAVPPRLQPVGVRVDRRPPGRLPRPAAHVARLARRRGVRRDASCRRRLRVARDPSGGPRRRLQRRCDTEGLMRRPVITRRRGRAGSARRARR